MPLKRGGVVPFLGKSLRVVEGSLSFISLVHAVGGMIGG